MAERRMFAKTIIDSDAFLDMPSSARLLYYDIGMRADDDGFCNSWKRIMRTTGASEDDFRILLLRKFVILFESGVIVIKHWRMNNYLRNDRYTETVYKEEKGLLEVKDNGSYTMIKGEDEQIGIPTVDQRLPQVRLDKVSVGKDIKTLSESDEWFKEFWNIYPKKVQRKTSEQKFKLYIKDEETFKTIIKDVQLRSKTYDWTKENGQFVPNPTTYLNQRRWEDELPKQTAPTKRVDIVPDYSKGSFQETGREYDEAMESVNALKEKELTDQRKQEIKDKLSSLRNKGE